jgi:hypothetical protein
MCRRMNEKGVCGAGLLREMYVRWYQTTDTGVHTDPYDQERSTLRPREMWVRDLVAGRGACTINVIERVACGAGLREVYVGSGGQEVHVGLTTERGVCRFGQSREVFAALCSRDRHMWE